MAFSKSALFNQNNQYIAHICTALSHPARIQIIRAIVNNAGGPVSYKEMVENIPLMPSTISQHIAYLRKMDIILPDPQLSNYYVFNTSLENTVLAMLYLVANANQEPSEKIIRELRSLTRAK